MELQIIFHFTKHKVCCSVVGRLGKISHLLHDSLVTLSPSALPPAMGLTRFLPGYRDTSASNLPLSWEVLLYSSKAQCFLLLQPNQSLQKKKKKSLCIRYIISKYWAILVFAPGNVAQGSKCHWMSLDTVRVPRSSGKHNSLFPDVNAI